MKKENIIPRTWLTVAAALIVQGSLADRGWSQTNLSPEVLKQEAKTKIFEIFQKNSSTITFDEKSSTLTAAERQNLTALINAAKNTGMITRVIVAAWGDQQYPVAKGAALSKNQVKLAKARAAGVKQTLELLGIKTIETYTMTENPNWFSRLFNTDDTKIKGAGNVADPDDRLLEEIGNSLRDKGGPGKAVVIVRQAGEELSH